MLAFSRMVAPRGSGQPLNIIKGFAAGANMLADEATTGPSVPAPGISGTLLSVPRGAPPSVLLTSPLTAAVASEVLDPIRVMA